jgi:hypothetical protein
MKIQHFSQFIKDFLSLECWNGAMLEEQKNSCDIQQFVPVQYENVSLIYFYSLFASFQAIVEVSG